MKYLVIFYGFLYFEIFEIFHLKKKFRDMIDYGSLWPELLIGLCKYLNTF
jgi:hypothetical protein